MNASTVQHCTFGLALGLLVAAAAAAGTDSRDIQRQATQSRPVHIDETTDREMAELWGLTLQQWHRYEKLRKGLAKYRSEHIDPIMMLGINARSPAERRKYAEMLVRMEQQRVQNILAFQRAYNAAWERLYPNMPRIAGTRAGNMLTRGRRAARRLGLTNRRKAVFVRTHDCADCRRTVKQLAAMGTPMDIFVIGAGSDDAIRQWAERIGLDPQRVRSGEITLNHAPDSAAEALAGQRLPRIVPR